MKIFETVSLPALLMALVGATNVFTDVIKKMFDIKKPQRVVVGVACSLSVVASVLAAILEGWTLPWQIIVGVICGILCGMTVSYGAMYGYDDLYGRVVDAFDGLFKYLWGDKSENIAKKTKEVK